MLLCPIWLYTVVQRENWRTSLLTGGTYGGSTCFASKRPQSMPEVLVMGRTRAEVQTGGRESVAALTVRTAAVIAEITTK